MKLRLHKVIKINATTNRLVLTDASHIGIRKQNEKLVWGFRVSRSKDGRNVLS